MLFVVRVRWSVCGKDAGIVPIAALSARLRTPSAGRAACADGTTGISPKPP